jgi:hypothetical protein
VADCFVAAALLMETGNIKSYRSLLVLRDSEMVNALRAQPLPVLHVLEEDRSIMEEERIKAACET